MTTTIPAFHADTRPRAALATSKAAHTRPAARSSGAPSSLLERTLLERLEAWLHRRAHARRDREIARFLALRGGPLTDDLEREIARHHGGLG